MNKRRDKRRGRWVDLVPAMLASSNLRRRLQLKVLDLFYPRLQPLSFLRISLLDTVYQCSQVLLKPPKHLQTKPRNDPLRQIKTLRQARRPIR